MTPDPVFPAEQDSEQAKLSCLMSAMHDERNDNGPLRLGCRGDCREHVMPAQLIAGAFNATRNTQVAVSLGP
jgi:hypothetical protein